MKKPYKKALIEVIDLDEILTGPVNDHDSTGHSTDIGDGEKEEFEEG